MSLIMMIIGMVIIVLKVKKNKEEVWKIKKE
jgi:hypothetical protein